MTPTRVLIFGRGQLGSYYRAAFASNGCAVEMPEGDIRDEAFVSGAVSSVQPDLIVNVAAKTNIDWCEMHKPDAFEINTLGADVIAKVAEERGVYLLHVSSGCVQESLSADEVHTEEDAPHPLCYYSWTKVWAENLLNERARRGKLKVLMLRPRQLLSAMVSPRNALVKMMTYSKFIDTPNSCTIVEDLMDASWKLLQKDATGLYNVANPGVTTPYRIAEALRAHLKPEMTFTKISKDELNRMTLAKRIDCVLSGAKLEAEGIALRPIDERLVDILAALKHNLESAEADAILRKTEEETSEKLALVG
ncbi:MAG TPA: sugar nucleotide-binding protein [Candidatus Baltobacteraceae bacterium]|nr:sugar nucleotide-binding protein [Candidatus Baltobacteraceae bacterium]